MPDPLSSALALARRGLYVFPVDHPHREECAGMHGSRTPCNGTRGKHPAVRFSEEATTDRETITSWFAEDVLNVAVACRPTRLVVIDEDAAGELDRWCQDHGKRLPPTYNVMTARGVHYYFRGPEGVEIGNNEKPFAGYAINVRGYAGVGGGYVVAAGSLHHNGTVYTAQDPDAVVAPLPTELVNMLAKAPGPQATGMAGYDVAAGGAETSDGAVARIGYGLRHGALVAYAGRLRKARLDLAEAEVLLRKRWLHCVQPPGAIPEAHHHEPPPANCAYPVTWEEAKAKLLDVFDRYPAGSGPDGLAGDGGDAAFTRDVDAEVRRLRVREHAKRRLHEENTVESPPFDADLLVDVLARPAEPAHRVDELIPSQAGTLVVAQRKTGKTTLELNLARSLLTGRDFLGRFAVRPLEGCVGFLNYEVSALQLARWAHEAGIDPQRLLLVNLRGCRNPLGNDEDRSRLAALLRGHEVELLITDPFGRAFTGTSQNDPGDVGRWLADFDQWARADAGATDVVLSAHAGWNGERTRGASSLEDWGDSIITLVRDSHDDQLRYLHAEGRDVLVEEDRLDYDEATRTLRLTHSGSRKAAAKAHRLETLIPHVLTIVTNSPGITGNKLAASLRAAGHTFQKGDEGRAAALAIQQGLLVCQSGPRGAKCYSPPPPPQTSPQGTLLTSPTSLMGGGRPGEVVTSHPLLVEAEPTTHPAAGSASRLNDDRDAGPTSGGLVPGGKPR